MEAGQTIEMKNNINTIILLVLSIAVYWFIFNRPENVTTKLQPIIKTINQKEKVIREVENRADIDTKEINGLKREIENLKLAILSAPDTITIVKYKDSIIYIQEITISSQDTLIDRKDSIIGELKYISTAKDTIIDKRTKQRNRSYVLNAILGGLLIVK